MADVNEFVEKLMKRKVGSGVFNQYREVCPIHDRDDAPKIRVQNLRTLLNIYQEISPSTLWVFEAPSHAGARRSGAPFINEGMFNEMPMILHEKCVMQKATVSDAKTALTTKIAWKTASQFKSKPMIWEAFPFHPFDKKDGISNRRPTNSEIQNHGDFLQYIISMFDFSQILAVGRVAESALEILGLQSTYIRHPAQGGAREFNEQIEKLMK